MKILKTQKTVMIWGHSNAWSLEPESEKSTPCTESLTEIEIQGDDNNGYNLVMSPEGFFTADYWYESLEVAKESASDLFGVTESEWS